MSEGSRMTAPQIHLLQDRHRALLALCSALEEMAAELEAGAVPETITAVAAQVEPLLAAAQSVEEERFYPALEDNAGSCFGSLMIAEVKSEHRLDRRAARELALTLKAVADHRCALSLDAVAHMTRSFQEYLRRHILAENMLLDALLATTSGDVPDLVP